MRTRHQISPHRWLVNRFVNAHLPQDEGLLGLDVGGPSPQPRPDGQWWRVVNPSGVGPNHGTVEDLSEFPERTYDIVQATDMLYLVANLGRACWEMQRVLRQDGVLVATVPFLWPWTLQMEDSGRLSPPQWHNLLTIAGFRDITIHPLGGKWAFMEQFLHAHVDWWPPLFCRLDRTHGWPIAYGIVART